MTQPSYSVENTEKPTLSPTMNWTLFGLILLATIGSSLASVAYNQWQQAEPVLPVLLPSALFLAVLSAPCIYFGLKFKASLGLAPQSFYHVLTNNANDDERILFWRNVFRAAILGIIVGALIVSLHFFLKPYVSTGLPTFGSRGPIGGFLVALRAGIGEEVWFRLGVMTAAVWAATRLVNQKKPSDGVIWTVILIAALLFAFSHIPQLNEYNAANPVAIWGTIIGNCVVGTLFGWCYWRYSLFAAMIAHFSVDIVIHFIPAFFL